MDKILIIGLVGLGLFVLSNNNNQNQNTTAQDTTENKRKYLSLWGQKNKVGNRVIDLFLNQMNDDEINIVYHFITNYFSKGIKPNGNFKKQVEMIGEKYNIFT